MCAADIEKNVAAQTANRPAPEPTELAAEDEGRACAMFLAAATQWNFAPSASVAGHGGHGVRTGLRYEALPVVAAAQGVVLDARLLADLSEIEAAVLRAEAEARK